MRRTKASVNALGDRLGDVDPLGGDAQLAGVGEAGPDRALGRLLHVGVVQDQQRVLAAELQRAADQPLRALGGDLAPGRGRSGEADVVALVDQLRPDDVARAVHHRPQVGGQADRAQQLHRGQRDQRRLVIGLEQHRVAGDQGRQAVGDRHGERVVPGRDHPDQALRHVVPVDPGEQREQPGAALVVQVAAERSGRSSGRSGRRAALPRWRSAAPCRRRSAPGR